MDNASWTTVDDLSLFPALPPGVLPAPAFNLANLETGSTRFTNSNEVEIVGLSVPEGYTHVQFTEDGDLAVLGDWTSTHAIPASETFAQPGADANITLYAWFTNTSDSVTLRRSQAEIIYTTAQPDVTVVPNLHYETAGFSVAVGAFDLDDGSTGGVYNGQSLDIFAREVILDGDPALDATPDAPYVSLTNAGVYSVRLRVVNEAGNAALSDDVCEVVVAAPSETPPGGEGDRFVALNNVLAEPPYDTWQTAAPDIQLAVNAAQDGNAIWIWPGRYTATTNSVEIPDAGSSAAYYLHGTNVVSISGKRVQLRGASGKPADVLIDGQGQYRVIGVRYSSNASMGPQVIMVDSLTITNGFSEHRGAAMGYSVPANVTNVIQNCVFVDNHMAGGTVINLYTAVQSPRLVVTDSLFHHNSGSSVLYTRAVILRIERTDFEYNQGTPLYLHFNRGHVVSHSRFRHNTGTGTGSAIQLDGIAHATIYNSLIADNFSSSASGAALYVYDSHRTRDDAFCAVINTTFAGNRVSHGSAFAGIDARRNADPDPEATNVAVVNSIVYGNTNNAGVPRNLGDAYITVETSCIEPMDAFPDAGNIGVDPLFVDPSGGNYRLSGGSPAINAGIYQEWMEAAVDLDGNRRIDGIYNQVDMGAYEYQFAATIILIR